MDDLKNPHIDDLVRRAMDDLGLEGDVERLPEEDQYRVVSKMLNYNLDILTKLNDDMKKFNDRLESENTACERIQHAKEKGRYTKAYENLVQ